MTALKMKMPIDRAQSRCIVLTHHRLSVFNWVKMAPALILASDCVGICLTERSVKLKSSENSGMAKLANISTSIVLNH